ncbi:MAG: hypothetical protein LC804_27675 [Acidobacteria bacterium]|nr:hypothetical protein [Acidobacteriota bacterium]
MFQPRVTGVVVLAGILLQNPVVFLVLSVALWWSAVPTHNPFDALYNHLVAHPRHQRPLRVASFATQLSSTLYGGAGQIEHYGADARKQKWTSEPLTDGGVRGRQSLPPR